MRTNSRVLAPGLKKRVTLMAAGLTVAIVLGFTAMAGPGVGVASADSAALVIDGRLCGLLDGNGKIVLTNSSHSVVTQSANGNRVLKCSVKGVASTGRAVHFDFNNTGLKCDVGILEIKLTANWHNKVSKSGNATLTCLVP